MWLVAGAVLLRGAGAVLLRGPDARPAPLEVRNGTSAGTAESQDARSQEPATESTSGRLLEPATESTSAKLNSTGNSTGALHRDSTEDLSQAIAVQCGHEERYVPASMILIDGKALWCPNAKVATTSIYDVLLNQVGMGRGERCSTVSCGSNRPYMEAVAEVPLHRHHEICSAYSFTFVRNPWDRVRSAYQNKVLEVPYADQNKVMGNTSSKNLGNTFPAFVRDVHRDPLGDIHWMSYQARCKTGSYIYDFVGKLEENFDAEVEHVITVGGLRNKNLPANPTTTTYKKSLPPTITETGFAVPHEQNSGYASTMDERKQAYLGGPGLRYPRELVDLVAQTYRADIASHGYSFTELA